MAESLRLISKGEHLELKDYTQEVPQSSYFLTADEVSRFESLLCDSPDIIETGHDGLVTFILPGDCSLSGLARTIEQKTFSEPQHGGHNFSVEMGPYESGSSFIYTGRPLQGIAHTKRIVLPKYDNDSGTSRIEVFDDRVLAPIGSEQRLDLADIMKIMGIAELDKVFNVSSNVNTKRLPRSGANMFKPSQISYLTVFKIAEMLGIDHVLSYMNKAALKSLEDAGLRAELYEQYCPPKNETRTEYDASYAIVRVSRTAKNMQQLNTIAKYVDAPTYTIV